MNIGIIMAGGSGTRMSAALPKQFIDLGGKPIIMHTLSKFLESDCFDAIYIGIHPDWAENMVELLSSASSCGGDSFSDLDINGNLTPIRVIPGGADRNSTLLNVLDAIEDDFAEAFTTHGTSAASNTNPIIVTHDAVRPFLTVQMIERSIASATAYGIATVAIPTIDTIATASRFKSGSACQTTSYASATCDTSATFIASIPDRSTLYNIQTPQSFRLSLFRDAYSNLSIDQIATLTDVCGIFTAAGFPIEIVPGSPENIKITTPFDLKLAELLLSLQK
ncbi:MAG: 2-C-methyl-D-erythritol 4-phosphate cytidylyltransferase [Firmicutes bacterium]|nr:2-C-methyl-D-erythritol 4-phosphate cytidylyltransferase [Bacillota bacterium]